MTDIRAEAWIAVHKDELEDVTLLWMDNCREAHPIVRRDTGEYRDFYVGDLGGDGVYNPKVNYAIWQSVKVLLNNNEYVSTDDIWVYFIRRFIERYPERVRRV